MAQAKATVDHDEIRSWVEQRGGCPAQVKGTGSDGDPGILRIDYPGFSGKQSLEPISWDTFFDAFEDNELAFLYQDDGNSRFSKLVARDSTRGTDGGASGRTAGAGKAKQSGTSARSARSAGSGKSAKSAKSAKADKSARPNQRSAKNAIELLEEQHREVESLFDSIESADSAAKRKKAFEQLADALAAHATIEETMFYPAAFAERTESELREAVEEHLVAKRLLADLLEMQPSDPQFMSKVTVLKEVIEHHVEEEEETLFDLVREQDVEDLDVLGARMQRRYGELIKSAPRKSIPDETEEARAPF